MKRMLYILILLISSLSIYAQKSAELSDDYLRFKLKPEHIQKWEDGTRTNAVKGTYEWWYFDFKLSDGSTMVIDFLTKPVTKIKAGPKPMFFVDITKADGQSIKKSWYFRQDDFQVLHDSCFVRMGKSFVKGNLRTYIIHIEQPDFKLDLVLHNTGQSWRPKTGYLLFENKYYFAWLVAVPQGTVTGQYIYNGDTVKFRGNGYHDHNWGNYPMNKLIHHWYWSRTKFGHYAVIAANVIAREKYGKRQFPLFVIFKDGEVIASTNHGNLQFYQSIPEERMGKPISEKLLYWFKSQDSSYDFILKLNQSSVISVVRLIDAAVRNKFFADVLFSLGFNPVYFRMTGIARLYFLPKTKDLPVQEYETNSAIWELMYFSGKR